MDKKLQQKKGRCSEISQKVTQKKGNADIARKCEQKKERMPRFPSP